jgi:hypothetical protein
VSSSSLKQSDNVLEATLGNTSDPHHQQQNKNFLGSSDRMSKEKQKFFRFSIFNSERKVNGKSVKSNSVARKLNKSKQVSNDKSMMLSSSSDDDDDNGDNNDEIEIEKNRRPRKSLQSNVPGVKKMKLKAATTAAKATAAAAAAAPSRTTKKQQNKNLETTSSSSSSTSSEDDSQSSCSSSEENIIKSPLKKNHSVNDSYTSSSSPLLESAKSRCVNKTNTINTMNAFACINSRDLENSENSFRYQSSIKFMKDQHSSNNSPMSSKFTTLNSSSGVDKDSWGFAAEAKKTQNVFATDDIRLPSASPSTSSQAALVLTEKYLSLKNNKSISNSHHRGNVALSNEENDASKRITPSNMFKKAVNYKKFDDQNSLNNNKCLLTDMKNHGQSDSKTTSSLNDPLDADSNKKNPSTKRSQSPLNNNNQFDVGKEIKIGFSY